MRNILLMLVAAIASQAFITAAAENASASHRAAIKEGVANVIATVDRSAASEAPRLGKNPDGSLRFFGAPPGAPARTNPARSGAHNKAVGFLQDHAVAFGIKSNAVAYTLKRDKTEGNRRFLRFQQTYQGLPVFAGEAIVQLDAADNISAITCDLMTGTDDLDAQRTHLTPAIDCSDAEAAAIQAVVANYEGAAAGKGLDMSAGDVQAFQKDLAVVPGTDLVIYDPSLVGNTGAVCLAYKVTVSGRDNGFVGDVVLIDAASGSRALTYSLVCSALNRTVSDYNNNWPDFLFTPTVVRHEGNSPTGIQDVDDAYDLFEYIYLYYNDYTHFGTDPSDSRNSYDNAGGPIVALVRLCAGFWFSCPWLGAQWNGVREDFWVGDGMAADDLLGHEFTHAVTQHESGLIYLNESGAINESLSDIFGEFIDLSDGVGNDDQAVRWLLGEDSSAGVARNMANPPASPEYTDPDSMNSVHYYRGTGDSGGVHINSGVNNKLCYLLTDGDTFRGYTVAGMGIDLVASLYYECQTNLLCSASNYNALYYALSQAAVNLAFTEAQRQNLDTACEAVEIRSTASIVFKDEIGDPVVRFTNTGNVILREGCQVVTQVDTLTPSSTVGECIVKDASGNPVAIISGGSLHTKDGIWLKGKLYEHVSGTGAHPTGSLLISGPNSTVGLLNAEDFVNDVIEPSSPHIVPAGSLILHGSVGYFPN